MIIIHSMNTHDSLPRTAADLVQSNRQMAQQVAEALLAQREEHVTDVHHSRA